MVNFELVGGVDFQKGCYPGPGGRRAQPVPRHDQAAHPALRLRRAADRRPGRVRRRRVGEPRARSPTPRRIPSSAAAARSSRCGSPRSATTLRLGAADGPRCASASSPTPFRSTPRSRPERRERRARAVRLVPRRGATRRRSARRGRSDAALARATAWPGLQARLLVRRRRRPADLDGDLCASASGARHDDGIDAAIEAAIAAAAWPLASLHRGPAPRRGVRRSRRARLHAQSTRSISTWAIPASSNSGPRRTKPARS